MVDQPGLELDDSSKASAIGAKLSDPISTRENYDLVVVGGGISGLAAAWFYRQKAGPNAKILLPMWGHHPVGTDVGILSKRPHKLWKI